MKRVLVLFISAALADWALEARYDSTNCKGITYLETYFSQNCIPADPVKKMTGSITWSCSSGHANQTICSDNYCSQDCHSNLIDTGSCKPETSGTTSLIWSCVPSPPKIKDDQYGYIVWDSNSCGGGRAVEQYYNYLPAHICHLDPTTGSDYAVGYCNDDGSVSVHSACNSDCSTCKVGPIEHKGCESGVQWICAGSSVPLVN